MADSALGLFMIAIGVASLFGMGLLLEIIGPLTIKRFSKWG